METTTDNGKTSKMPPKVGPSQIIEKLRMEAAQNPAFNAIAHIFALRERTRAQVTIKTLANTMLKEGFSFSMEDYENILKFLHALGLGTIDVNHKGRVRGLKNIKVTLQSIGLATVARKEALELKTAFIKLPVLHTPIPVLAPPKVTTSVKSPASPTSIKNSTSFNKTSVKYQASLKVNFDGEDVMFDLPDGIGAKELGVFLSRHYKLTKG